MPARDSLEASVNRLGIPTRPRMLKTIVVASFVGLLVQYLILPFVGIGALTGYDAGLNALLISLLTFVTSFTVAYKMRGGGGRPRARAR